MKFGKELEKRMIEEWREWYIDYKLLKTLIKNKTENANGNFQEVCLMELNKIADFGTRQKVSIEDTGRKLRAERNQVEIWRRSEFPDLEESVVLLQKKYIDFGRKIVNFLEYIELNVMAVDKILKKCDKYGGQQTRSSLLEKYERTHLNVFLDVRIPEKFIKETDESLSLCQAFSNFSDYHYPSDRRSSMDARSAFVGRKLAFRSGDYS